MGQPTGLKLELRELFPCEPFRFIRWQKSPQRTVVSERWWCLWQAEDWTLVFRKGVGTILCRGTDTVATYRGDPHPRHIENEHRFVSLRMIPPVEPPR